MTDLTFSLADIRRHHPCRDGWAKLLASLGPRRSRNTRLSLGYVAWSNDAADAIWCVRCIAPRAWGDIAVRRAVIGALLPAVRRAHREAMPGYLADLIAWQQGGDIDLRKLEAAADAAAVKAAVKADWDGEARAAAVAAATVAAAAGTPEEAAEAAGGASDWAEQSAEWEARAAAPWEARAAAPWEAAQWPDLCVVVKAERELQRADIIAAFPPIPEPQVSAQ